MKRWIYSTLEEYLLEVSNDKLKSLNDEERNKQKQKKELKLKLNDERNQIKRNIILNDIKQKNLQILKIRLKKRL
jgi:hypothetical protein|tara:strand:- start:1077 stop:1301 length:225 start_codon:yes stop_codon:yes gene_type:complete